MLRNIRKRIKTHFFSSYTNFKDIFLAFGYIRISILVILVIFVVYLFNIPSAFVIEDSVSKAPKTQPAVPDYQTELSIQKQNVKKYQETLNKVSQIVDKISGDSLLQAYAEKLIGKELDKAKTEKAEELQQLMYKYVHNMQFNTDCSRVATCDLNKYCGFGCQAHHVLHCLHSAIATNRTLILNSAGWSYSNKGWEAVFLPITNCAFDTKGLDLRSHGAEDETTVFVPIIDSLDLPFQYPKMPANVFDMIMEFHPFPQLYWNAILLSYLMRMNQPLQRYVAANEETWSWNTPIVGIHIRRTDKIGSEAQYHTINEYMDKVEEYFTLKEAVEDDNVPKKQRYVFLATDDASVLPEAEKKYPSYKFISNVQGSQKAGLSSRYSEDSLFAVVADIIHLSRCEYIVCTFSSQICRLAYELMQLRFIKAYQRSHSLDDPYYYGGQKDRYVCIIKNYESYEAGTKFIDDGADVNDRRFKYVKDLASHKRFKLPEVLLKACLPSEDFPSLNFDNLI